MKNKHRIKQGLSLLLAGGIALTNLGAALPAFAEDAATTPETAQTATLDPDAAVLYADLPDAPAGSYIGSEGLPVATGQTKIGLSLWADGQLEQDSHLDPDALNSGDKTVTVPLTEDTDYAIVPLMAQVEYPADGSRTDVLLPENVTLLDYYGEPAQDATVLHSEYKYRLSLGGVSSSGKEPLALQEFLRQHPEITTIELRLDNDAKGRMASVGIQNLYREKYQVCDLPPNIENGDYADMAKNNLMARTAAHRAAPCR